MSVCGCNAFMTNEDVILTKILEIVQREKPDNVTNLVDLIEKGLNLSKNDALECIQVLENSGRLELTHVVKVPQKIKEYLLSPNALWFQITIFLVLITTISIFFIPVKAIPLVYVRYVLGAVFLLFLPGYSLIKILFPVKELDNVERFSLSFGSSLVLVPLIGFFLNYSPWGITITSVTLGILILTVSLAVVGVVNEHQVKITR